MMKAAQRAEIDPFIVMDVVRQAQERVQQGEDILHLEIGQPSTGAPQAAIDVAKAALDSDPLGYTVALGIDPLRYGISQHYQQRYGLTVPAERIVITPGSSAAFILAFLLGFDPGSRIAVPTPGYPCYRNIIQSLGLVAVDIQISAVSQYLLLAEDLQALDQPVDGVIVSSPGNPTGSMYSDIQLKQLVNYCQQQQIHLISDEIYHGIQFTKPSISALQFSDQLMVINSFSKYFSMTGWRIGWMVVPEHLVRPLERLMQNLFISTSTLSQLAAVAALQEYPLLDTYVANYKVNRDLLIAQLTTAGLDKITAADGAFYLYIDVSDLTNNSVELCQTILAETGVALTPGVDFDPQYGHHSIRLSYAAEYQVVEQAAQRLVTWLQQQSQG